MSASFLHIFLPRSTRRSATVCPPPQGWEYAVDFPANFSPDKKWNSCVRRRRWIRYRRYTAQGTWAKVPTLLRSQQYQGRKVPRRGFKQSRCLSPQIPLDSPRKPLLPLCDISCGGWQMSDQSGRYPYLWGVSQQGEVSPRGFRRSCDKCASEVHPREGLHAPSLRFRVLQSS